MSGTPEVPERLKPIREAAKKDLFFFARHVLKYDWLHERVHGPICALLSNMANKRVMITMPRNYFKSVVATISYPLWRAVNDPNVTILMAMNKADNASAKLRELRQHVENNTTFQALFPEIIPDFAHTQWGDKWATVNRSSQSGTPTFSVTGASGSVISQHYDEIIMDDLVTANKDDMTGTDILPSNQDIEKGIGWYRTSISLLRDTRNGRLIHVGTRWATKDVIEFILRTNEEFARNHYNLRAAEKWPEGPPTFPERYPMDVLREVEQTVGSTIFRLWYLNEPVDPKEIVFALDDGHYYDPALLAARLDALPHYVGVDLAISDRSEADNNAIVVIAVDEANNRYVRQVTYGKFQPMELIDLLFAVNNRYHPRVMGIEAQAYQAFLPKVMSHFMRLRDTPIPIVPIMRGSNEGTDLRVMALQPFLHNRMLFLHRGLTDLIREMQDFRLDRKRRGHDDALSALADAVRLSAQAASVARKERLTAEEIRQNMAEGRRRAYSADAAIEELTKPTSQSIFDAQTAGQRFAYLN